MGKAAPPKRVGEAEVEPSELVLDAIDADERVRVVDYLREAEGLIAGGYWTDPVTEDPEDLIPYSLKTDGSWVWASPWAYLVGRYGAALPAEFLEHIRALDYRPAEMSVERIEEVGDIEGVNPPDSFWAEQDAREAEEGSAESG